jgi:hypothetical protein
VVKANVQAQPDRASAHGVERGCFSLRVGGSFVRRSQSAIAIARERFRNTGIVKFEPPGIVLCMFGAADRVGIWCRRSRRQGRTGEAAAS